MAPGVSSDDVGRTFRDPAMTSPSPSTFAEFVKRIRAGDAQAATELVRRYEPLIRREVRLQLEDRRLARLFDSMDICQSVLGSFFVRAAMGEYDLEQPQNLVRLLVTMTRNKLASAARRHRRLRRDDRRVVEGNRALEGIVDDSPEPYEVVADQELLQRARQRLSAEERRLAELRGEGLAWIEIAALIGGTPQARRMQLSRAVKRVVCELGIDEDVHA